MSKKRNACIHMRGFVFPIEYSVRELILNFLMHSIGHSLRLLYPIHTRTRFSQLGLSIVEHRINNINTETSVEGVEIIEML